MSSNDSKLSNIARNLKSFENGGKLFENYLKSVKSLLNSRSILVIDGGDITKTYAKSMEGLSTVRDGSTGEYKSGYHKLGITALSSVRKLPVPVYTKVYSSEEDGFVSEDEEVITGLEFLSKHFKKSNIRTFDRGFDNNRYYRYLISRSENFVIRAKKNRDVIYNGKRINVLKLAHKFKGKYCLNFTKKGGIKADCKVSMIPVSLPCMPDKALNLVVCYGFGEEPMLLITNLNSNDKALSVAIVKVYLMRWRIEEYYRFKKQQFNLEYLRVPSLNAIRNLELFITVAVGYVALIGEKSEEQLTAMQLINCSKRIYKANKFVLYAIADGIFAILSRYKQGINNFLISSTKSPNLQLSLPLLDFTS